MSINLILQQGKNYKPFPFQTPTYLTKAVLAQDNRDDMYKVFSDYFGANYHKHDQYVLRMLKEIRSILDDKSLTLTSG